MAQIFYFALILLAFGKALSQKPVYFKGDCNALKRNKTGLRAQLENEISFEFRIRYNCYVEKLARRNVANVLSTNPYKYQHGNLVLEGLLLYTEWPFSEKVLIKTVRRFAKNVHKYEPILFGCGDNFGISPKSQIKKRRHSLSCFFITEYAKP